jgi:hypothetical protein
MVNSPSVQEIKRGWPEGVTCTCSLGQDMHPLENALGTLVHFENPAGISKR